MTCWKFGAAVGVIGSVLAGGGAHGQPVAAPGYRVRLLASGLVEAGPLCQDPRTGLLLVAEGARLGPQRDGRVVELRPDGSRMTVSAGYYTPNGILVDDAGVLFVTDLGPTSVSGDTDGVVWRDDGAGPVVLGSGTWTSPSGLAQDLGTGDLVVAEATTLPPLPVTDGAIFSVNPSTGARTLLCHDGPGGDLRNCRGPVIDRLGRVLVADNGVAGLVLRVTSPTTTARVVESGLADPVQLAIDGAGTVFICDLTLGQIRRLPEGASEHTPMVSGIADAFFVTSLSADRVAFTAGLDSVWIAETMCHPLVTAQPVPVTACPDGSASLAVTVDASVPVTYQWRIESPENSGVYIPLFGAFAEPGSMLSFEASGIDTPALNVRDIQPGTHGPAIRFAAFLSTTCGTGTSNAGVITVLAPDDPACAPCNGDYNMDGAPDTSDIVDLTNDIASGMESFPPNSPDFNRDGGADTGDVIDIADVVAGGPCP